MEVKVIVNGVEILAPIEGEDLFNLKLTVVDDMIRKYAEIRIEDIDKHSSEEVLTDDEFEQLQDNLCEKIKLDIHYADANNLFTIIDTFMRGVYDNKWFEVSETLYNELIENRPKFYEVSIDFSGSFTIYVKAPSAEAARDEVDNLSSYELFDYVSEIDPYEVDFDINDVYASSQVQYEYADFRLEAE